MFGWIILILDELVDEYTDLDDSIHFFLLQWSKSLYHNKMEHKLFGYNEQK